MSADLKMITPKGRVINYKIGLVIIMESLFFSFIQAFLCDEYRQSHPQDAEKLEDLQQLIAAQVRLIFVYHLLFWLIKKKIGFLIGGRMGNLLAQ